MMITLLSMINMIINYSVIPKKSKNNTYNTNVEHGKSDKDDTRDN